MTEIERIVWADPANLELLNQLRDAVEADLADWPIAGIDPPSATAEGAVTTLLDEARLWSQSPRLVSLIVELETLSSSFAPTGRVRRLRQLSPEAVAALLDEAPGGPALAYPVALTDGEITDRSRAEGSAALLTARPAQDARLLGRLGADGPRVAEAQGVAISFLPAAETARLRALFAAPDAPGRGDLAALKADLDEVDRAHVAAGAARAADHLRFAFRIADNRREHRRGSNTPPTSRPRLSHSSRSPSSIWFCRATRRSFFSSALGGMRGRATAIRDRPLTCATSSRKSWKPHGRSPGRPKSFATSTSYAAFPSPGASRI